MHLSFCVCAAVFPPQGRVDLSSAVLHEKKEKSKQRLKEIKNGHISALKTAAQQSIRVLTHATDTFAVADSLTPPSFLYSHSPFLKNDLHNLKSPSNRLLIH